MHIDIGRIVFGLKAKPTHLLQGSATWAEWKAMFGFASLQDDDMVHVMLLPVADGFIPVGFGPEHTPSTASQVGEIVIQHEETE
jgi:hypothetical protein